MNTSVIKPMLAYITKNVLARTSVIEEYRKIAEFIKNEDAMNENRGIAYDVPLDKHDCIIELYKIKAGRVNMAKPVGERIFYEQMGRAVNFNFLAIHNNYQNNTIIYHEFYPRSTCKMIMKKKLIHGGTT